MDAPRKAIANAKDRLRIINRFINGWGACAAVVAFIFGAFPAGILHVHATGIPLAIEEFLFWGANNRTHQGGGFPIPLAMGLTFFVAFKLYGRAKSKTAKAGLRQAKVQLAAKEEDAARQKDALDKLYVVLKQALERLKLAQDESFIAYEKENPKPCLSPHIKSEAAYSQFHWILELRKKGWGFGRELQDNGRTVRNEPVDVKGVQPVRFASENIHAIAPSDTAKRKTPPSKSVCPKSHRVGDIVWVDGAYRATIRDVQEDKKCRVAYDDTNFLDEWVTDDRIQ
jgi:hypothetical protein